MIDQRKFARVKVLLPAEITVEEKGLQTLQAVCLDLSVSGVLCQTEQKLPVGALASMRIQIADGDELVTGARVVRIERIRQPEGYRIGFEFSEPSTKMIERVTHLLLYPRDPNTRQAVERVRAPFAM